MPSPEILAVLADEVADVAGPLAGALGDYSAADDPVRQAESIERYREHLQRLTAAAGVLTLAGLEEACAHVDANVVALNGRQLGSPLYELLERWPALVVGYLRAPKDGVYSRELVDHCRKPGWLVTLDDDQAMKLGQDLAMIMDSSEEMERPARPTQARPEDVTLDIASDVNPSLVESFLAEAPLLAGAYTSLVEAVIRGGAGPDSLNEARRHVHSIKGAANTIGVRGAVQITHHLEDLLEYLGQRSVTPQGAIAKMLIDAADCLEMMLESLMENKTAPIQAQSVLQRLLDVANAIDRGEAIEGAEYLASETQREMATAAPAVQETPIEAAPAPAVALAKRQAPAGRAAAEIARAIRVAAATIDEMLRLSSEMTIGRSHVHERLHVTLGITEELREQHVLLQARAADLDRLVTVQGVAAGQKSNIGSDAGIFDALEMDQYSELHGAVHGFLETAADVQALGTRVLDALSSIETAITQEGLLNAELHEQIMRARMVPASNIEPRLARTLRQVCDATGKRAVLDYQGGDVMLDDHVVNDLINPLTHLLRNAVDHGLERPQERVASGKSEEGTVRLSFARDGNHMVISCEDDGAGLDIPRIRAAAVQRGLIAETADLSEAETARLILQPGFSTSEQVSEISGRGVGMDIVHTAIRMLKGTLDIRTFPGKGTRFVLRLPLTLGSAHCLVVRSGGEIAAIPTDVLDRVVHQGSRNIQLLGKSRVFREEGMSCEVHELDELLGHSERLVDHAEDARPVVIVKDADRAPVAVVVDALLSGRDLVIKNLGRYLVAAPGVVGASILADGRVLPVLDMHELLRLRRGGVSIARPQSIRAQSMARPALTHILVVDDSLSVRQALTQLLEDDGYQVHTAKDGMEALECVAKERPAAILVDLEMPRMNGLELTQHLRRQETMRHVPVIMVTSRSSEKHRTQARQAGVDVYLTKPYRESDLLAQLRSMLTRAA